MRKVTQFLGYKYRLGQGETARLFHISESSDRVPQKMVLPYAAT